MTDGSRWDEAFREVQSPSRLRASLKHQERIAVQDKSEPSSLTSGVGLALLRAALQEHRDDQWCVLQHHHFGIVEGEFFETERLALARFHSLPYKVASMVIQPDGKELRYFGLRAGRDADMKEWWSNHTSRGRCPATRPTLAQMFCVVQQSEGQVEGEFFRRGSVARSYFASMRFLCAAMVIGPGGVELDYWGPRPRGGHDAEMMSWWRRHIATSCPNASDCLEMGKLQLSYGTVGRLALSYGPQESSGHHSSSSSVRLSEQSWQEPVLLHIYDVWDKNVVIGLNDVLRIFGMGAYHAGLEVYGKEWTYGGFPADSDLAADASGIGWYAPRSCSFGHYKETVYIGRTHLSADEIERLLKQIAPDWSGWSYDLLGRNCCDFCNIMCQRLANRPLPAWVMRLPHGLEHGLDMVEEGKEAWSNYKFGDVTRGVVRGIRNSLSPNGSAPEALVVQQTLSEEERVAISLQSAWETEAAWAAMAT